MGKKVFLTGGTGFIGNRLCALLNEKGYQIFVYSRRPAQVTNKLGNYVAPVAALDEIQQIQPDILINLAGEPIIDRRWSSSRKQILRLSRIGLTKELVTQVASLPTPPSVMISGSAIGYYGNRHEQCDESTAAGSDFAARLCIDWEQAARQVESSGVRLCILRTGIVMDKNGGALSKIIPQFKLGLGGVIGSGKQWLSWVHREDLCRLIIFLIEHPTAAGIFNGTSPHPVTNREFTQTLAGILKKPAILPVPKLALKLILGEASTLLTGGQKVMPQHALDDGFAFNYDRIETALNTCV